MQKVVALGDIHANYKVMMRNLQSVVGCVDLKGKWIGGNMCVIFCGDLVDRKNSIGEVKGEELKILRYLLRLDLEARRYGGEVVLLIGNHEFMNLVENNDWAATQLAKTDPKRLYKLRRIYLDNPTSVSPVLPKRRISIHARWHHIRYVRKPSFYRDAHLAVRDGVLYAMGKKKKNQITARSWELLDHVKQMLWDRKHECPDARAMKILRARKIVVGHCITKEKCEFERWENGEQIPIAVPPYTKIYTGDHQKSAKISRKDRCEQRSRRKGVTIWSILE